MMARMAEADVALLPCFTEALTLVRHPQLSERLGHYCPRHVQRCEPLPRESSDIGTRVGPGHSYHYSMTLPQRSELLRHSRSRN